jgi:pilus assembly protein CpaD
LNGRDEDMQMTRFDLPTMRPSRWRSMSGRALLLAGVALALSACQHSPQVTTGIAETAPADYRQRHPIAIKEGQRTVELFVGRARGGLSPVQQADVAAFAHAWRRESSGGIIVDVPAGTENARAAQEALVEVRSILTASGVPAPAITTRPYRPVDPRIMANLKLNYPKMVASAGPCGLWPDDLGRSWDRRQAENGPYWNLGCATQRNFAAMVENPADLVQPRGDTPLAAGRRSTVLEKYRKGEATGAASNPDAEKGKITEIGK